MPPIPDPSSAWLGGPLRSSLAMRAPNHDLGTLGVVISIRDERFFTCSYHVVGDAPATPRAIEVYAGQDAWTTIPELKHLRLDELAPGDRFLGLDLTLLHLSTVALNIPPVDKRISLQFGGPAQGDTMTFRGLRESTWVRVVYEGFYQHADESWSRTVPFETASLGVIEFIEQRDAVSYAGDSGAVLWAAGVNRCFAVGHLIAVSLTGRRGLILNYRSAFEQLELNASVVGEPQ